MWNIIRPLFMIGAFATAATPVFAETYYISNTGNDANTGTSPESAWKSARQLTRNTFEPGDQILFKSGDRWQINKGLTFKQSGTAATPIVIGAYYLDKKGNPQRGYLQQRPILDGGSPVDTPTESTRYLTLLRLRGHFITVENMQLQNFPGEGLYAQSPQKRDHTKPIKGLVIRNNVITNMYSDGIGFMNVDDSIIEDNEITETCKVGPLNEYKKDWPAAIAVVEGSSNNVIRRNRVRNNYGEGIDLLMSSSHNQVDNNLVVNNHAIGIYIERGSHNTVKNNLIFGTQDKRYHRWSRESYKSVGAGIAIANEPKMWGTAATGNIIANNLVAYTAAGIALGGAPNVDRDKDGLPDTLKDNKIHNNTFVANTYQLVLHGGFETGNEIHNNIFWTPENNGVKDVSGASGGIKIFNNHWTIKAPNGFQSEGDIIGNPGLLKQTGWRAIKNWKELTATDFTSVVRYQNDDMGADTKQFAPMLKPPM